MRKILAIFALVFGLIWASGSAVQANEGVFELQNIAGDNSRCFATSVLMVNFDYELLISCRDLKYPAPAGDKYFHYVLWTQETIDGDINKLGSLEKGKAKFKTRDAFVRLFVTQEMDPGVRKPSETTIMVGDLGEIANIADLSVKNEQTEAVSDSQTTSGNNFLDNSVAENVASKVSASNSVSGMSILRVIGSVLLGIVVFVIVIGFISTRRRRPIE